VVYQQVKRTTQSNHFGTTKVLDIPFTKGNLPEDEGYLKLNLYKIIKKNNNN
jgi:hypothetical protein